MNPTLQVFDGHVLRASGSSLGVFETCNEAGRIYVKLRRRSAAPAAGRDAGLWAHAPKAAQLRGYDPRTAFDAAVQAQPPTPDDYRTPEYVWEGIKDWLAEPLGGELLWAERSFELPLGKIGEVELLWRGISDCGARFGTEVWVIDWKTASSDRSGWMDDWWLDRALIGYCHAAKLWYPQDTVRGVKVSQRIIRPPLKPGSKSKIPRFESRSEAVIVSDEMLAEWQADTLAQARRLVELWPTDGPWPQNRRACGGKYQACPYLPVCRSAPRDREALLATHLYCDVEMKDLKDE